jgi:hypothetical protein
MKGTLRRALSSAVQGKPGPVLAAKPQLPVPQIVDFVLTPGEALERLRDWNIAAPHSFQEQAKTMTPRAVFLPFWVFRSTVHTKVRQTSWLACNTSY